MYRADCVRITPGSTALPLSPVAHLVIGVALLGVSLGHSAWRLYRAASQHPEGRSGWVARQRDRPDLTPYQEAMSAQQIGSLAFLTVVVAVWGLYHLRQGIEQLP